MAGNLSSCKTFNDVNKDIQMLSGFINISSGDREAKYIIHIFLFSSAVDSFPLRNCQRNVLLLLLSLFQISMPSITHPPAYIPSPFFSQQINFARFAFQFLPRPLDAPELCTQKLNGEKCLYRKINKWKCVQQ